MKLQKAPFRYRWRSSRRLFVYTICIALFSDMFLFGFIVPILPFMIEDRLHLNPSRTQRLTSALLTTHGFFSLVSAPIIGYFADKSPSRKIPLLAALAGCIIGTLLIAWTPSLWTLFLGRVLQAIAGSGAWVIGFALLTESVPAEDLGMTIGIAMTFVTAGILSGPAVAGLALELLGYWPTWSIPLGILALDLVSRLTVLEPRRQSHTSDSNSDDAPGETTGLLSDGDETGKERSGRGFYRIMLQDQRVLAGLLNGLTYSMVLSALDNTLPTHLKSIFDWGSFPTGLMFFGLQVSSIPLSGPFGYLRDRCGLKIPTTIGWILSALMLCSLGIPGYSGFPWAGKDTAGKPIFIGSILGLGMSTVLVRGVGFIVLSNAARSMQARDPHIFGPHGGNSRASSMMEVACGLGMMFGPLLSGILSEAVNFHIMAVSFAMISLLMAVMSYVRFDGKPVTDDLGSSR